MIVPQRCKITEGQNTANKTWQMRKMAENVKIHIELTNRKNTCMQMVFKIKPNKKENKK